MPESRGRIEAEILKKVTPSQEERDRVARVTNTILEKVQVRIDRFEIAIEPLLVGSIAKDTWLPDPDIDIFMTFPLETPLDRMEEIGLKIGEEVLGGEKRYAEHPYTHGVFQDLEVDLVPCYRIERPEQKMTAVDRTPLHTEYVKKHLKEVQKSEVRLLKRFLRGIGVYGAEAKIQGFSGYLSELLVLRFETFAEVVRNASTWKKGHVIDSIPASKSFDEPLVVVDPIDAGRNVASALSMQNLATFVFACQEYLRGPKQEFFFPKPFDQLTSERGLEAMRERGTHFLVLVFDAPDVVEDVLYPQLRKCEHAVRALCTDKGFSVYRSDFAVLGSEAFMLFEFEVHELPKAMKHIGPPVWVKNAQDFYEKWCANDRALSKPYVEGDHLVVDIRRRWTSVSDLIKHNIDSLSLGKDIDESVKKRHSILQNEDIVNEKRLEFLSRFLTERMPWEN